VVDPSVYYDLGEVEERSGDLARACAAYARAAAQPLNRWVSSRAKEASARIGCQ